MFSVCVSVCSVCGPPNTSARRKVKEMKEGKEGRREREEEKRNVRIAKGGRTFNAKVMRKI